MVDDPGVVDSLALLSDEDTEHELGPSDGFRISLYDRPYGMAYMEFLIVDANQGFSAHQAGVRPGHYITAWEYEIGGETKRFDSESHSYQEYLKSVSNCPLPLHLDLRPGLDAVKSLSQDKRDWDPFAELLYIRYGFYKVNKYAGPQEKLFYACKIGSIDCLQKSMADGADILEMNHVGRTALHYATMYGFNDCVKFLLSQGADVNVTDMRGQTPASWACCNGRTECLLTLVEHNANLTIPDRFLQTPLHYACGQYFLPCVKILIENAPQIIDWQDDLGTSAICKCSIDGFVQGLSYLYEHGGNLTLPDSMGRTPAMVARDSITATLIQAMLQPCQFTWDDGVEEELQ